MNVDVSTKQLCILVLAPLFLHLVPYLHQFSAVQVHHHNLKNYASTAPFDDELVLQKIGANKVPDVRIKVPSPKCTVVWLRHQHS